LAAVPFGRAGSISPKTGEATIARDEPGEHVRDKFHGLDLPPSLPSKKVSIEDEVSVHLGRQFEGELDRPVVGNGVEFQLGHD
jgi:hypothetical protein